MKKLGISLVTIGAIISLSACNLVKKKTTPTQTSTSETVKVDISKYDKVIEEAKSLTAESKFKESDLKLATIPVSDLGKKDFAVVKETVDSLNAQNSDGLKRQEEAKTKASSESQKTTGSSTAAPAPAAIPADYSKWATAYSFYFARGDQKQMNLYIAPNGQVTQTNTDGTQFTGYATIAGSGGSVLSYETNVGSPTTQPKTKNITPNVQVTIHWDNGGGTDTYYGYISYSQRLALTDGIAVTDGVKEVWVAN